MSWSGRPDAEKQAHWLRSEQELATIIEWAKPHLPVGTLDQVDEYLDHAEYGLGLELLYELLIESALPVPPAELDRIAGLARHMGIQDEIRVDRLRRR